MYRCCFQGVARRRTRISDQTQGPSKKELHPKQWAAVGAGEDARSRSLIRRRGFFTFWCKPRGIGENIRIRLSPGRSRAHNRPHRIIARRCLYDGTYTDLTTWPDFILPMFCLFVWLRQLLRASKSHSELFPWTRTVVGSEWPFSQHWRLWCHGLFLSAYCAFFMIFIGISKILRKKKLKCKFSEDSLTLWHCDVLS